MIDEIMDKMNFLSTRLTGSDRLLAEDIRRALERELDNNALVSVPMGNGRSLVAECGVDPDYPEEIYIYIQDKDGSCYQDIVNVHKALDKYRVRVYENEESEDATRELEVKERENG